MRGVGDRPLGVADGLHHVRGDVVGHIRMHGVLRGRSGARTHHGGQHVVLDADALHGVLGRVAVGRHHQRDGLADVADHVLGEDVLGHRRGQRRVGDQQRAALLQPAGEVLVGVDRDEALDVERIEHVDVADPGVRVGAADHGDLVGVVVDVVDVGAQAAQEPVVLAALDTLADHRGRHGATSSVVPSDCPVSGGCSASAARSSARLAERAR